MNFNKDQIFDALEYKDYDLSLIFKDQKKIDEIKTHPFFKPYLADLFDRSKKMLGKPIEALPFSLFRLVADTGNREIFQAKYFEHRYRLITFAILAWLYPDVPEYLKETEDILWAICDEYTWALPAHISGSTDIRDLYPPVDKEGFIHDIPRQDETTLELFGTETALAIAEITTILQDRLHPKVTYRARKLAYDRVIRPYFNNICFWEDAPMNWCSVCSGNIGATAIYLVKDEPTLTYILRRVLFNMDQYLTKGFKPDGTTTEGLSYWMYGFSRFTYFADLLKRRTNGKIDLLSLPEIIPIVQFPEKSMLHNSAVVSFSDNGATFNGGLIGLMSYLKAYSEGLPTGFWASGSNKTIIEGNATFPGSIRNLLWTNLNDMSTDLPIKTYILRDGNWVTSRGHNKNGFAAKGGSNDESHNHNDVGNLIYQIGGEVIFPDLGQGEYTTQYFNATGRYELLCTSSKGHNVPIIDDKYQYPGANTETENFDASTNNDLVEASMDIQNAYKNDAIKLINRKLKFNAKNGDLAIKDTFEFNSNNHNVKERFISKLDATIDEKNSRVIVKGKKVEVAIDYDASKVNPIVSYENYVNHDCIEEKVTLITFEAKETNPKEIVLNCHKI